MPSEIDIQIRYEHKKLSNAFKRWSDNHFKPYIEIKGNPQKEIADLNDIRVSCKYLINKLERKVVVEGVLD